MAETFDLYSTYLHLDAEATTTAYEVGDDFWQNIPAAFGKGRLVGLFQNDESWTTWEAHPKGDEVVFLLDGAVDLILDEPEGERVVSLKRGQGCIVPRGVFHTATVHEPGATLHITPGSGTQIRPR